MDCIATRLPYRQTGAFTRIVLDYIDQADLLKPFFAYPPTIQGIREAINTRKKFPTNREVLVSELKKQYADTTISESVRQNLEALLAPDTFTITTAHQNNIFTGPLYFIYKTIHIIRLTDQLNQSLPGNRFVPVFYIGSEDADLDELDHIYLEGEKLSWNTKQTGAVGRMKIDKDLLALIDRLDGRLSVLPHGSEIMQLIRTCYKEGVSIQEATFHMLNALFGDYGLIVLLPDSAAFKQQMEPVFRDELFHHSAAATIEKSADRLQEAGYKVQAAAREINLFYLKDNLRERIEKTGNEWKVVGNNMRFTEAELRKELSGHPERFSPNVILRGLYQETILPNVAFVGGGGELSYWLELKDLFGQYKVPFPVLVLRNSFQVVENKWQERMARLGFNAEDFFLPEDELLARLVTRESDKPLQLNGTYTDAEQMYAEIKKLAGAVDSTLEKHVEALKLKTIQRLQELEKKMLRAEKRRFSDQQRQIHTIKSRFFPMGSLQERVDNLLYYYALWGKDFINQVYKHSLGLEQEFVLLQEKK